MKIIALFCSTICRILIKVAEREAYGCVTQYVQCELFQTPKVVMFTQLISMLKEPMLSLGVEIQECSKKH